MVFLRLNVAFNTFDISVLPRRVVGNPADVADVGKTMAFEVSFRHHKEAVLVA
ncbi:hypothetical protein D3C75_857080 [compost metagenome]